MTEKKWFRCVIFFVGVYINTFVFAMLFAFGAFLNAILDKYIESRSKTAAIQSIFIGFGLCSGILSGILLARFGLWKVTIVGGTLVSIGFILSFLSTSLLHLYACISVTAGLGVSILFIAGTTSVGMTFTGHYKLLFLALQNTGASIGVAALPYLFNVLLDTYGLNGTFLLIGGFYLNCIPLAMLFKQIDEDALKSGENKNTKSTETLNKSRNLVTLKDEIMQLWKNVKSTCTINFTLTSIGIGLVVGSLNGYFALILDILKQRGLSTDQALLAFPITYGAGFFARILPGLVKQLNGVSCLLVPILLSVCGMVGQLVMIHSHDVWAILFGCGLSGITISGVASSANIIAAQMVQSDLVSIGIGLEQSCMGIVAAITAPVFGAIRDNYQSYDVVQYIAAGCQVIGVALFFVSVYLRKSSSTRRRNSTQGIDNIGVNDIEN